ncbi:NAD(P)/FAD-dependent oxidoreductase [Streptomyces sp. NPDC048479]|uniref:NAD(P)/FAD-dependent oxidoreductase n=1 Tax=Streptomyces sp. NPDC048479 TaxID=3154725 RepID=UPI00342E87B2
MAPTDHGLVTLPGTERGGPYVDVLIIGAGPTGLFAGYCAGFRGLSAAIVDAQLEAGGQISALYPEKAIHDIAGFPRVRGRDLVAGLLDQALSHGAELMLGHQAETLSSDGEHSLTVTTDQGARITAGAVVITGGIGSFTPRPLPAADSFRGTGVASFIPEPKRYAGLDVVIAGGGDSAFDWACALSALAASVTLVHRRSVFRAHRASVEQARRLGVRIVTEAEITRLSGPHGESHGPLSTVSVRTCTGAEETLPCQGLVAALGFTSAIGPLAGWGLKLHQRKIVVDSTMRTTMPRVFAAGDITQYPGKVRLMAVGFGEAATAVNNAAVLLDPTLDLFPGHSTDAPDHHAAGTSAAAQIGGIS